MASLLSLLILHTIMYYFITVQGTCQHSTCNLLDAWHAYPSPSISYIYPWIWSIYLKSQDIWLNGWTLLAFQRAASPLLNWGALPTLPTPCL